MLGKRPRCLLRDHGLQKWRYRDLLRKRRQNDLPARLPEGFDRREGQTEQTLPNTIPSNFLLQQEIT